MDPEIFYCCQCTVEGFQNVYELRDHYREAHCDMRVVCKNCCNQFRRQKDLETHEEEEHKKTLEPVTITCVHCDYRVFSYKFGLKSHNGCLHAKHQVLCKECGNVFLDYIDLNDHVKKHHTKSVLHYNQNLDRPHSDDEEGQSHED